MRQTKFWLMASALYANVALADIAPPDACYQESQPCLNVGGEDSGVSGICGPAQCERGTPDGSIIVDCLKCLPDPNAGQAGAAGMGGAAGAAGSGTTSGGTAGNGTATGGSGNGTAGNGTAGNGTAGNGTAGNGTASGGTAGSGSGNGTTGNGAAGNGTAGGTSDHCDCRVVRPSRERAVAGLLLLVGLVALARSRRRP